MAAMSLLLLTLLRIAYMNGSPKHPAAMQASKQGAIQVLTKLLAQASKQISL